MQLNPYICIKFKYNIMPIIDFKIANKKIISKETPKTHGFSIKDYNRICVYAHYYNNEINPFYIGQGTIARAFAFSNNIRNKSWKNKVKQKELIHVEIINIDITIEESIKTALKNQFGYSQNSLFTNMKLWYTDRRIHLLPLLGGRNRSAPSRESSGRNGIYHL